MSESPANDDADCPCSWGDRELGRNRPVHFHRDAQDPDCDGWKRLLELVERAANEHWVEFDPLAHMPPEHWTQIVDLPPSIARLTEVRKLMLYGSHLVRVPPEIGQMTNLVEFVPYTSARLHWMPYEITRCSKLARSTISTRHLYGNFRHRAPFPQLEDGRPETAAPGATTACSICSRVTDPAAMKYVWTSQPVGTDVVPLLVNACSEECIDRIPPSPEGYSRQPHHGGPDHEQPRRMS